MHSFSGFERANGAVGIRNAVLVISGDLCCNPWSREIASSVDGCHAVTHKHGVGNFAPDRVLYKRLMRGITTHPNTAGFVYVSSGNEDHVAEELLSEAVSLDVPHHIVSARTHVSGGPLVREGIESAEKLVTRIAGMKRTETAADKLVVGLNCAGTDTASETSVHPVVGAMVDMLVQDGATVILTETPDLIGLGDTLFNRCERAGDRVLLRRIYRRAAQRLESTGEKADDIEMVAFNTEGGLTSLKHKAGVSVLKAGSTPVRSVIEYGAPPDTTGLVFMDGPAMTDFVMAGFMGSGVHLMINTCGAGAGNKMPFTVGADMPSPILPAFKVSGSSAQYSESANHIDFSTSGYPAGESIGQAAGRLYEHILRAVSGEPVRTEWGGEFMINFPMSYHQP